MTSAQFRPVDGRSDNCFGESEERLCRTSRAWHPRQLWLSVKPTLLLLQESKMRELRLSRTYWTPWNNDNAIFIPPLTPQSKLILRLIPPFIFNESLTSLGKALNTRAKFLA